ncbi:hypothetical protein M422DRAFT_32736 [Sphaerobolus stellatus SS14]|uniref:Uncharacterized protein n=1 Tax=Sphaerobolus stellatus (strain SS14) TaxID=990650 RepID=A0A0C9VNZ0_SPHS4|nr:hypothetical protein M422DRAFT_32736 [Sphaerobolus stellatus SS14]
MSSLLPSHTHQRLSSSSQPPSPIEEEDLSQRAAWEEREASKLVTAKWKGKGKAVVQAGDEDDEEDNNTAIDDASQPVPAQYPPLDEEEQESRRVEENLKRMAVMEKEKRKQARGSLRFSTGSKAEHSSAGFSVGEVGKRVSGLWNSGWDKSRPDGRGHQVVSSIDESVPLETSPPPTPSPNPNLHANGTADSSSVHSLSNNNPFEDPRYMVDMNAESIPIDTYPSGPNSSSSPRSRSKQRKQSPPRPLNLPDPVNPQSPDDPQNQRENNDEPKRWWTDWLCGCREEGDVQAGRTNPME